MGAYSRILLPWDSQPQEVVGVDWSNPLSVGLVAAFLPTGSTFFDAVSGLVASTSGAVVSATPSPVIDGSAGAAIEIRGSTGTLAFPTGSTGLDKIAGPFSIFAEGGLRLNGSSENLISSQDASLGKGIQLVFDDAISVINGFVTRIDNSSRGNSGSAALGSNSELYAHRVMCSGDGTNIYSYAKRALVKTDAAAFTPTANASRVTRFFGTPFSSGNKTGGTVVYAFNRVLSLAEYQRLYDNPWQLLAPRSIWVPVSAGGGTTISGALGTATASGLTGTVNANTTIAGALGTASASGLQGTVNANTTIAGTLGTAVASGLSGTVSNTNDTVIGGALGIAIASGLMGTVNASTVISGNLGTAVASGLTGTVSNGTTTDMALILKILSNRQELNATTGKFTLYDDDGVTVLYESDAWEDTAGTIPYRGKALRRIDALA